MAARGSQIMVFSHVIERRLGNRRPQHGGRRELLERSDPRIHIVFNQYSGLSVIDRFPERRHVAVYAGDHAAAVFAVFVVGLVLFETVADKRSNADMPAPRNLEFQVFVVIAYPSMEYDIRQATERLRHPTDKVEHHAPVLYAQKVLDEGNNE